MEDLPKKIWFLWLQGQENAPELTKRVIKTWVDNNPGWEVNVVNSNTLGNYIHLDNLDLPNMSAQAASDIIRLRLLSLHGGVWVDATMPCLQPLDGWVKEAIEPCGFWMYHGRDMGRGPASWFMISKKGSIIANKWMKISDDYWNTKPAEYHYHWMDILFGQIALNDHEFLTEWKKVPFKWCEDPYSAHSLAKRVYTYDPDHVENIIKNSPFAIKLCNHGVFHQRTNAHLLLDKIDNKEVVIPKLLWGNPPSFANATFFP